MQLDPMASDFSDASFMLVGEVFSETSDTNEDRIDASFCYTSAMVVLQKTRNSSKTILSQ